MGLLLAARGHLLVWALLVWLLLLLREGLLWLLLRVCLLLWLLRVLLLWVLLLGVRLLRWMSWLLLRRVGRVLTAGSS